jgi:hypothetical protein
VPGNLARSKVSPIPSAGHSSDFKKSTELHRFFFQKKITKQETKKKKTVLLPEISNMTAIFIQKWICIKQ